MFHPDNGRKNRDGALFWVAIKQCVIVLFVDKKKKKALLTKPPVLAENTSHF